MEKISFQFRDLPAGYRAVAFNEPLDYFATHLVKDEKGNIHQIMAEMTVKDCRHIDGCVYFAKGRVSDRQLNDWIELYNKVKDNGKWKKVESAEKPKIIT